MSQELTESGLYALLGGARGRYSEHNMQDFASLYHKYDSWLRRKALMLCRVQSDAEDLVSELWLRVIERSPEWISGRVIHKERWLLTVLYNLFRDQRRRLRPSPGLDLAALELLAPAPHPDPDLGARGEALLQLVDHLPPADRELLLSDGRRSPGTQLVDARTANLQRVRRYRLRRKLMEELSIMETAASQEQRPDFSRGAGPTEEADHEP